MRIQPDVCRTPFPLIFRKRLIEVRTHQVMWPRHGSVALTLPTCLTFIGQVSLGMCLQQLWLIAAQISRHHHAYQNKHSAEQKNTELQFPWEKREAGGGKKRFCG